MQSKVTPRKEEWEYSKNKNTIRARQRKARLDPYRREVEQAKAADQKSITRAWKIHAGTNTYQMASEEEKEMILENVKRDVMEQRRKKGIDAQSKEKQFMARLNASANITGAPPTYENLCSVPPMPSTGAGMRPSSGSPSSPPGYGVGPLPNYQHPNAYIGQTSMDDGYGTTVAASTPSLQPSTVDNSNIPAALNDKIRVQALENEVASLKLKLATAEQKVGTLEARVEVMARMMGLRPGGPGIAADVQVLADTAARVAQQLAGGKVSTAAQGSIAVTGDTADTNCDIDADYDVDTDYNAYHDNERPESLIPFGGGP
ncbi:hypothetical protein F5Y06DRAFT_303087 [Hypoxylon sp. FL0890]|nr:hypothetical protein F5Y06DRAFT_303087 [Hypoxylon sp. FL0890]